MRAAEAGPTAAKPKLVVLVVIDQFRGDYPDRYAEFLGSDGLQRLMREGAFYPDAHYSHGTTATGPGHACISTGSNPRTHGIASNDNPAGECVEDARYPVIGMTDAKRAARGIGPLKLLAPTLGDMMKLSSGGGARVVSVGLKARATVLLAGRKADRAIWWDSHSGHFVTSKFYGDKLPAYIEEMNAQHAADKYFGRKWERALPEAAYARCTPDDEPAEVDRWGLGRTFPHPVDGGLKSPGPAYYEALWTTPYGNDLLMEAVRRTIDGEQLGKHELCDLLCVAMSAFDEAGHFYGPDSHEMLDFTVRTDRSLADLWKLLDEKIGRGKYVIALTADHGAAPVASVARRFGLDAGEFREKEAAAALNAAVRSELKIGDEKFKAVSLVELPWVHLDHVAIQRAGVSLERVVETCARALPRTPGVGWVFRASQLAGPLPAGADDALRFAWQAYHPQLAGDFYIGVKPYWHKAKGDQAAAHSTFNSYDRHVPIMLFGPGVRPGRYLSPADPIDISRTICVLLGVEPAATMSGRVLGEAFDARPVH